MSGIAADLNRFKKKAHAPTTKVRVVEDSSTGFSAGGAWIPNVRHHAVEDNEHPEEMLEKWIRASAKYRHRIIERPEGILEPLFPLVQPGKTNVFSVLLGDYCAASTSSRLRSYELVNLALEYSGTSNFLRPTSSTDDDQALQLTDLHRLIDRVVEQESGDVDQGIYPAVLQATAVAKSIAKRLVGLPAPTVHLTDEGAVTMRWRNADRGVLIVLVDEQFGTHSVKEPGGSYSGSMTAFNPKEGVPQEVADGIAATR
jgi:hypothetical protein